MTSIAFGCLALLAGFSAQASAADAIAFWDAPRHGANSFNRLPPDQAYFNALRNYGASWVRLSYDKWTPARRDFLLGDADNYSSLATSDLATLKTVLSRAEKAGLKVVITPLSLPYMRWAQNNDGRFDDRLWQDKANWTRAEAFWRDLAGALKNEPAVAAYNLINEPAPERRGGLAEHANAATMRAWYARQAGGARDLVAFYAAIIKAVREVDPNTPIMVDAGWYAAADDYAYWPAPLADARILYSFHMYEPYAATGAPNLTRSVPYSYPGVVPYGVGEEKWDRRRVQEYLQLPVNWAKQNKIAVSRLVAGEFGCVRRLAGCRQYLEDVLSALDQAGLHWAFYSFREDNWDGMDYELGGGKVPWSYWKAIEAGRPDLVERQDTPEFEVIRRRLQ